MYIYNFFGKVYDEFMIFNKKKKPEKDEEKDYNKISVFADISNEKDLDKLKRLITKESVLYEEILNIRKGLSDSSSFPHNKIFSKKVSNLEKKAHERGKTKTPTNSEMLIFF